MTGCLVTWIDEGVATRGGRVETGRTDYLAMGVFNDRTTVLEGLTEEAVSYFGHPNLTVRLFRVVPAGRGGSVLASGLFHDSRSSHLNAP